MTPIEYLYYLGYSLHKRYRLSSQKRLDGRVVSVGNLTLGGTGKTPVVIAIAEEAIRRGLKPCILTRGYGGDGGGSVIVSSGGGPLASWAEAGDEAVLMAERLKGAWVIKDANRYRGGLISGNRDIFLLDDGFQHWRLHRDLDIVVVDATNPFGRGRLIPLGRLREPVDELKRADIIIINKAGGKEAALERTLRSYNKEAPIFYGRYRLDGLAGLDGRVHPVHLLKGGRVFAFCGIGNPGQFIDTIGGLGAFLAGRKAFRDHHSYRDRDLRGIIRRAREKRADFIVTTEKDLVKIRGLPSAAEFGGIFALKISLEMGEGDFFDIVLGGLTAREGLRIP